MNCLIYAVNKLTSIPVGELLDNILPLNHDDKGRPCYSEFSVVEYMIKSEICAGVMPKCVKYTDGTYVNNNFNLFLSRYSCVGLSETHAAYWKDNKWNDQNGTVENFQPNRILYMDF